MACYACATLATLGGFMFEEKRKAQLEKQAKHLASLALVSLSTEKAMKERASMMSILNELNDVYNSVALWGDKNVMKVIKMGYDKRYKKMLSDLLKVCIGLIEEIEHGNMPNFKQMHDLDNCIEDLRNWRI
jgi:hypothetical protein